MATRDLVSAAVEALTAHLVTTLPTLTVLRGWPESDTDLDMSGPGTLSVEAVPGMTERLTSPSTLGDVVDGEVEILQAIVTIPVQLDLFAPYRATLDASRLLVDRALHNALPFRPHLYLTATDHDARPFTAVKVGDDPDIDGETADRGEWRHSWRLDIHIERVAVVTMAATTEINASSDDELTVT